jgi:hypothetical protein
MIGSLIAFGTQGSLAVLGVLAYRLISFWLPTLPGGLAYVRLRRTVGGWRALQSGQNGDHFGTESDPVEPLTEPSPSS